MAVYQVATIDQPESWRPKCPDDVPPELTQPRGTIAESNDLFEAVRQAIDHNQQADAQRQHRWAVVVEPGGRGRKWPGGRLCTPLSYKVVIISWPEGWEPRAPTDVPNCVWQAEDQSREHRLSYQQAVATVRGLNQQCMDQPGTSWHVVAAVENEPVSQTVSYDPTGMETTSQLRRLHVIRPEPGGRGDCSHCPAHGLPCAREEWTSQAQTVSEQRVRTPTVEPEVL